jgi:hypothetical protein
MAPSSIAGPMPTARPPRALEFYYLIATPAFALADRFWGISVRAAFLDGWPAARYGYYAVCFGCGLWAWRAPRMARSIAIGESSVNIVLLIFSTMLGYYDVIDKVAADQPVGDFFGPQRAANLAIAAVALMVGYFRSRSAGKS